MEERGGRGRARLGLAVAAGAAVLTLASCGLGQPSGYQQGVEDAQMMAEFGDPEMLAQLDNELNYQGFCEGTYANFGGDVPIDNRPGYIEGCIDTIRAMAESLR